MLSQRLYDERGLYLEISPKGGMWWRFKYRFNNKEKRISLGTYPDVSLQQAREKRDEARKHVADGIDPSTHRQGGRRSTSRTPASVLGLCHNRFFNMNHGPVDGKRHEELMKLFATATAGLVYVTAFPSRGIMARYVSEIAWETEVWVADAPSHLIHFNGIRFLGPYNN